MKGFFPAVIEAVRHFRARDLKQPIIVLATADEETSMAGARALSDHDALQPRFAIIGEPTGLVPIRMHKGIHMQKVVIQGQAGHSSDPSLGNNALDAMQQVLTELISLRQSFIEKYQHEGFKVPHPTLNLGCIHGGDNPNRICGQCELQFDLRATPGMNTEDSLQLIEAKLEQLSRELNIQIDLQPLFSGVAPFEEPACSELVKLAEKLTGHTAQSVAFATEAPFLQNLGAQTIVMGPGSIDQAHQADEFIALEQINPAITVLRGFIEHFCLH